MSAPETEPESCFIDTNVWLYAFIEGDDRQKSTRAKLLIEVSRAVIVNTQVINEVCVNLIRKAQFSEQQVQQLIESFYAKYSVVELNKLLLLKASALRAQTPSLSGIVPSWRVHCMPTLFPYTTLFRSRKSVV